MYIKDFCIKRWGTSKNTYECINIFTNGCDFLGSLHEAIQYANGHDVHTNWNTQSWACDHMFHLPSIK